ncbi:MAG TPA: serine/threonine-protein kinase [Thermoanaerobaculia bacterium]|nr:serine/threonine-protein kinase [Thermoanaerobaculia bacterium]
MDNDLTYVANPWPGWDIPCHACGAGCRAVDRFCSQCGVADPTGRFANASDPSALDLELTAPTHIAGDADEMRSDATMLGAPAPTAEGSHPPSTAHPSGSGGRSRRHLEAVATLERILVPGGVFGRRYRIQRFLGAGAMGYVCSAVDSSIDEVVALKILSAPVQEDPDSFERFKTELKLARKIRHRNVVQSFDLGFADGFPYISMEYVDADNLHKHLSRRASFPEPIALSILRQVLRGLRAAHELGIIHRDIKPENILLNKDGIAFITDFGIATSARALKAKREIAGTPDYMSPEQLRGNEITPASDLYSCGVMLYRMLAGRLPFEAKTITNTIAAHLHDTPDPLPADLEISEATRTLVDDLLKKDVADRPPDASGVLDRVEAALSAGKKVRSSSSRITILVAEEDPQTMALLRSVLETDGYRVVATSTAEEAVNLAFEQNPSLILLDAEIKGGMDIVVDDADTTPGDTRYVDGIGFLRILREDERLSRVPVVVMTGATEVTPLKDAGAAEFLRKPLAPGAVTDTVRRLQIGAA